MRESALTTSNLKISLNNKKKLYENREIILKIDLSSVHTWGQHNREDGESGDDDDDDARVMRMRICSFLLLQLLLV